MLCEIAITNGVFEPKEIVNAPARKAVLKSVLRSLCYDNGRLLCNMYDGKWEDAVYRQVEGSSWLGDDVRAVLKLLHDRGRLIPRHAESASSPGDDIAWLREALSSHRRLPFYAILTRAETISKYSPKELIAVCTALDSVPESPLWNSVSRSVTVERTAKEMAKAVAPILRTCRSLLFIDPFFNPELYRYRRSIPEFLKSAFTQRYDPKSLSLIEIHTSHKAYPDPLAFREAAKQFSRHIPSGVKVNLVCWKEHVSGPDFHNRYILTNHSGVAFLHGLDEKPHDSDEIVLLDEDSRGKRWRDFQKATSPYVCMGKVAVIGTSRANT